MDDENIIEVDDDDVEQVPEGDNDGTASPPPPLPPDFIEGEPDES